MALRLRSLLLLAALVVASSGNAFAAPTLTILTPGAGRVIGDSTTLRVRATATAGIASVVASIGGRTATLAADSYQPGTYWVVSLPVTGLSRGWLTLAVTATDAQAGATTRTEQLLLDRPPVITVTSPVASSVRPAGVTTIALAATCADDTPGGCRSFRALDGAQAVIARGTSTINQTVALRASAWNCLQFRAADALNQENGSTVCFYDAPGRTMPVDQAPQGVLVDADATKLLSASTDFQTLYVTDRASRAVQSLASPVASGRFASPRLTPHGVISRVTRYPASTVHEWRDGAWSDLPGVGAGAVAVRGGWAAWAADDDASPANVTVYRRDLDAGQTTVVDVLGQEPLARYGASQTIDVSATGTVTYVKAGAAGGEVWRSVDGVPSAVAVANGQHEPEPRGDGTLTAFTRGTYDASQVVLATPSGETALTPMELTSGHRYAVGGEWTALARWDATTASAWLRRPNGDLVQMSSARQVGDRYPHYDMTDIESDGHLAFHRYTSFGFDEVLHELFEAAPGRLASLVGPVAYQQRVVTIGGVSHICIADTLFRITPAWPRPLVTIDTPGGSLLRPGDRIDGWALDLDALESSGIDAIHVWAEPLAGGPAQFVGSAVGRYATGLSDGQMELPRPDVAAAYGAQYATAGFSVPLLRALPAGSYRVTAYAHSSYAHAFVATGSVTMTAPVSARVVVETPPSGAIVSQPFTVAGWAIDLIGRLSNGSGIDVVQLYAYPATGGAPLFLGTAGSVQRPDIAAQFGPGFLWSGWTVTASGLPAGRYTLAVFARRHNDAEYLPAVTRSVTVAPAR